MLPAQRRGSTRCRAAFLRARLAAMIEVANSGSCIVHVDRVGTLVVTLISSGYTNTKNRLGAN